MKLTRRDLIRYGAGVSLVAAGGGWGALMADSHGLIEVTIPSSGRKVPAVGIGTVSFRGAPGSADPASGDGTALLHFKAEAGGGRVGLKGSDGAEILRRDAGNPQK